MVGCAKNSSPQGWKQEEVFAGQGLVSESRASPCNTEYFYKFDN